MGTAASKEPTGGVQSPFDVPSDLKPIPLEHESDSEIPVNESTKDQGLPAVDSSDEEEKESFVGWLSASTASERSNSVDARSGITATTMTPTDPSTSGGLDALRPSADSPLVADARLSSIGKSTQPTNQKISDGVHATTTTTTTSHDVPRHPEKDGRTSGLTARGSICSSTTEGSAFSPGASARSSFAIERASVEANRHSLEAFQEAWRRGSGASAPGGLGPSSSSSASQVAMVEQADAAVSLEKLAAMLAVPADFIDRFAALSVIPLQTPVPINMLCMLWNTSSGSALATATVFARLGILNVAQLPNNQVWALPQAQQLQLLHAACREGAEKFHESLLKAYSQNGQLPLSQVPEDGYFLANVGHHLLGANRPEDLKQLLLDPSWLEKKLAAIGPACTVADFRRYLLSKQDRDIKLLLEAFQMSVGHVLKHKHIPGLLRCMLAGRLMTAPLSQDLQTWLNQQQAGLKADGLKAAAVGLPHCLPPSTPSLDQAGGLQRLALRGHTAAVTKVLLSPSGTDAVTGSDDGTVRVWDLEIGDCTLLLEGHVGAISAMAITDDGSLLVSASEDGTARAYELERGQCLRVLAGHEGPITALGVDPWGRFVATGGKDGTVKIWDLGSAQVLHTFTSTGSMTPNSPPSGEICCLALSPCTKFILFGSTNFTAELCSVVTGQRVGILQGHTSWVSAVAFTGSSTHALTASHDGTLRYWSLKSGKCVRVMEGHKGRINAMSVGGKLVATAGEDGTARVWDIKTGACVRVLTGHNGWVSDVAIFPGQDQVITTSGDATAIAWNLDSGEVLRVLEGHSAAVLGAVVTRRGRFAVTCSEDGSVRVWDFTASSSHTPKWHEGKIRALTAADGILVATAGDDCVARLWDAVLGEYKSLLQGHVVPIRWTAFSADGRQLLTASPDRNIRIWDCETTECVMNIPIHPGSRMKSFATCHDLSRGVMCLFDGSITLWNLQTGENSLVLQARGVRDESKGHSSAVNEVLMTNDGATVVTLSKDFTSRVWDSETGTCKFVLKGHTDSVTGGCIGDQGRLLVTHSFDNTLRLWSLEAGDCLLTVPVPSRVARMALSSCGNFMAVALVDNSLLLMYLSQVGQWMQLKGHSREVTGLAFSQDETQLASCSEDGTLCVWEIATGQISGIFVGDCGLTCCHYDSLAGNVVLGTDRGVVHFVSTR